MTDVSGGPGWWQASDGKWYAPELHPDATALGFPSPDSSSFPATSVETSSAATDNVFAPLPSDDVFPRANDQLAATGTDSVFPATTDAVPVAATDQVFPVSQPSPDGGAAYPSIQYPSVAKGGAKSKIAAGLLGIFLGWLGIHRFYLGYKKLGWTMLLLSILSVGAFIPVILVWGLIEGVLILTGVISKDAYGDELT